MNQWRKGTLGKLQYSAVVCLPILHESDQGKARDVVNILDKIVVHPFRFFVNVSEKTLCVNCINL